MARQNHIYERVLAFVFLGALLAPALDHMAGLDAAPRPQERRRFGQWSDIQDAWRASPADVPAAMRSVLRDRFGFRNVLLRLHARATVLGLGISNSDQVTLGTDGWLYFSSRRARQSARASDRLSETELDHLLTLLETRRELK